MKRSSMLLGLAVLVALAPAAGCRTYRPLEPAAIRQGTALRLTTARPVPVGLREVTIEQARRVDGEAILVRNDTLLLSAFWVEREGGVGTPGEGWTVGVPLAAVSTLTERRVSWLRSAILGAAVVVGSALGWKGFGLGSGGEDTGRRPGSQL
jgi:hypothetical protein